jgi:hypothetical protein
LQTADYADLLTIEAHHDAGDLIAPAFLFAVRTPMLPCNKSLLICVEVPAEMMERSVCLPPKAPSFPIKKGGASYVLSAL